MANLPNNNFTPNTLSLHAGYDYDSQRTLSVPIYQSTAYSFENAEQAAARFSLEELGNIYSRLTNPTVDMLAKRIAAVEGGAFGVATASGSSAVFYSLVNLAQNGDNIAYSNKIYGGFSNFARSCFEKVRNRRKSFRYRQFKQFLKKL